MQENKKSSSFVRQYQAAYDLFKVGRNEYTLTIRETKLDFEIKKYTSIVYTKEDEMYEILNEKKHSVFKTFT